MPNKIEPKILLVADAEFGELIIRAMQSELGFKTQSAICNSKDDALLWVANQRPDLIILDWSIDPDFLHEFRLTCEHTPVIVLSNRDKSHEKGHIFERGANDFLRRPIDWSEFLAKIKRFIAIGSQRKHLEHQATVYDSAIRYMSEEMDSRELETIFCLAKAAEYRDPETGGHIMRMAHYSRLIAKQLGLPEPEQEMIFTAAPMHDVGKVGIPDAILLKPGRLNDQEMNVMRTHTTIGHGILVNGHSPSLQVAAEIALTHHEKFDGSGYPNGLVGEEIPIFGRIVAVADVFDALTSTRPYKTGWPVEEAKFFLIAHTGTHFDPLCVDAFMDAWGEVMEVRERYLDSDDDSADE